MPEELPIDGPALADDELDAEGGERGSDSADVHRWRPKCKVVAGVLGGALVYGLQALGVDVGAIVGDVTDLIGVDPPNEETLAALLGGAVAAYLIPEDFCER